MTCVDSDDPYQLQRFVDAQGPVFDQVRAELAAGNKTSHWMWFVFPQLKELGRSATARHYGVGSKDDALAYWQHPVLGPRLKQCTELVCAVAGKTAHEIFHSPDDLKFRSCITLFACALPQETVFKRALNKFFGGEPDATTIELLCR